MNEYNELCYEDRVRVSSGRIGAKSATLAMVGLALSAVNMLVDPCVLPQSPHVYHHAAFMDIFHL
jgi:hypothetical protein